MATASGTSLVPVSINFHGQRTVLHLAKNIKVSQAIQKAAEAFKVPPEGLTFLYHGNEITDDMLVGDALCKAGNVTVIHLISVKDKKSSTARLQITQRENVYGHCKKCGTLVTAREVFTCSKCGKCHFQRASSTPLDHFAQQIHPDLLIGTCPDCGGEQLHATVEFECSSCVGQMEKVCPLRQVRDNKHKLPCMKCGLRKDMVFRMACSSRHTICIDCFNQMCQVTMGADKFRFFEGMGYSLSCPGPGDDCPYTPVPDPHHFKIVDDDAPKFYDTFITKSVAVITPSGHNILCTKCFIEIDVADSQDQKVTEPATASVTGLKWYQKLFAKKPTAPPPRTRKHTTCRKCGLGYCIGCKQVWHEGDCLPLDKDMQQQESMFPIDPVKAKESCWPQDSN